MLESGNELYHFFINGIVVVLAQKRCKLFFGYIQFIDLVEQLIKFKEVQ